MRKTLYLLIALLTISCMGERKQVTTETSTDRRAQTDTTLIFQGLTIGAEFDSAMVDSIKASMPMSLVDKDNREFVFTNFFANGKKEGDKTLLNEVGVSTSAGNNPLELFLMMGLYLDKYDDFSYVQMLKNYCELFGFVRLGDMNPETNRPYSYQDATNAYFEAARNEKNGENLNYTFVWEWNNQSIRVCREITQNECRYKITYCNYGYAERKEAEEEQKRNEDSINQINQQRIERIKSNQQI